MQMVAIIGAVVAGIVMWIGNSNYKKGAAWGQPVAVAFGIVAIGMGIWALTLNGKSGSGSMAKEIQYQTIRAEKLGKYIAANFANEKILVMVNSPSKDPSGKEIPNHQLEGLKKGLGSVSFETLVRPISDNPDEGPSMEEMDWQIKHVDNLLQGKDGKGKPYPGMSPAGDFTMLITLIGLPENTFKGGKAQGKLSGKKIAFVQGFSSRWTPCLKKDSVVAAVTDKPYPQESDKAGLDAWEQNPPADLDAAFAVRFELKTAN